MADAKRRGTKAGKPRKERAKAPPPRPEIGEKPLPTPSDIPPEQRAKRGQVRTGRWPVRKTRPGEGKQRPHGWALQNRWQPLFIAAFAGCGNDTYAARKAGVSLTTVRMERSRNPEFESQYQEARQEYIDEIEAELARRVFEGTERVIIDRKTGEPVPIGKVTNDILLMFYIKRFRPEYRENYKTEDDHAAAKAVQATVINFLRAFDPNSDDQSLAPTLDVHAREIPALPPPDESLADRIDRLRRELAEAQADATAGQTEGGGISTTTLPE